MIQEPKRLSYSSLSTYAECGERWRLERGYGLTSSTWFATVAGSAVHSVTEVIDLKSVGAFDESHDVFKIYGGDTPTFQQEFDRFLDDEEEKGREVKPSGRVTKSITDSGGPNKKDYDWWIEKGPGYVNRYIEWRKETDYTILELPDGKPAIEVVIPVDIGGEPQLGFIDRVFVLPEGTVMIVDLKTGDVPKSKIQLGVYKTGLQRAYGITAEEGAYWMGKDGQLTPPVDLSIYSSAYLDALFEQAWRGIRAGVFLPNVSAFCNGCGVKDFCRAVGGSAAISKPMLETVVPRETNSVTTV